MKCLCLFFFLCVSYPLSGQVSEPDNQEEMAENLGPESEEGSGDLMESPLYLSSKTTRINVNSVTPDVLAGFPFLSPIQRIQFFRYRTLLGPFTCLEELQAIPYWDLALIRKLLPYVTIQKEGEKFRLVDLAKKGRHELVFRFSRILENSRGYETNRSGVRSYSGDPLKALIRYSYRFRDRLQFGLTLEKDPGEKWWDFQNGGADFYSFHFLIRKGKILKNLVIGDYLINLGQGLTHWQGFSFHKSSEVLQIKRESPTIVPYRSVDENRFHRGGAFTLGFRKWELSGFVALDRLDANLNSDNNTGLSHFTSFQTSGFHRTDSERSDKDALTQTMTGFRLAYQTRNMVLSLNSIYYHLSVPYNPAEEPYRKYSIRGNSWNNTSFDFQYSFRNGHFFGEWAVDKNFHLAWMQGVLLSLDKDLDLALLYRHLSKEYQSFSGNAFTEGTAPTNEKGFYAGLQWRPNRKLTVSAYFDRFEFPWLRFGVDHPGFGWGSLVQLSCQPLKEMNLVFRYFSKLQIPSRLPLSDNSMAGSIEKRTGFRVHMAYIYNKRISFRLRQEFSWVRSAENSSVLKGYLIYFDFLYHPTAKPLKLDARIAYFETDSYDSRIYGYENDVLYYYVIPSFSGKGIRYYLNIRYKVRPNIQFFLKWSQTIFRDKETIGSGNDQIPGNQKSELKFQIVMEF